MAFPTKKTNYVDDAVALLTDPYKLERPKQTFVPTSFAGCVLWLRPDLGVVEAGGTGTGVSTWTDQSGSPDVARSATQPTLGLRPALIASDPVYAGKPTVQSSGTKWMTTGVWSQTFAQPTTIILVGETVSGGRVVDGNGAARQIVWDPLANGFWGMYAGSYVTQSTAACTAKSFVLAEFNTTASALAVNSTTPVVSGQNVGTQALQQIGLFGLNDGSGASAGKIAELIVFSRLLTPAEKSTMAAYVNARYALSVT